MGALTHKRTQFTYRVWEQKSFVEIDDTEAYPYKMRAENLKIKRVRLLPIGYWISNGKRYINDIIVTRNLPMLLDSLRDLRIDKSTWEVKYAAYVLSSIKGYSKILDVLLGLNNGINCFFAMKVIRYCILNKFTLLNDLLVNRMVVHRIDQPELIVNNFNKDIILFSNIQHDSPVTNVLLSKLVDTHSFTSFSTFASNLDKLEMPFSIHLFVISLFNYFNLRYKTLLTSYLDLSFFLLLLNPRILVPNYMSYILYPFIRETLQKIVILSTAIPKQIFFDIFLSYNSSESPLALSKHVCDLFPVKFAHTKWLSRLFVVFSILISVSILDYGFECTSNSFLGSMLLAACLLTFLIIGETINVLDTFRFKSIHNGVFLRNIVRSSIYRVIKRNFCTERIKNSRVRLIELDLEVAKRIAKEYRLKEYIQKRRKLITLGSTGHKLDKVEMLIDLARRQVVLGLKNPRILSMQAYSNIIWEITGAKDTIDEYYVVSTFKVTLMLRLWWMRRSDRSDYLFFLNRSSLRSTLSSSVTVGSRLKPGKTPKRDFSTCRSVPSHTMFVCTRVELKNSTRPFSCTPRLYSGAAKNQSELLKDSASYFITYYSKIAPKYANFPYTIIKRSFSCVIATALCINPRVSVLTRGMKNTVGHAQKVLAASSNKPTVVPTVQNTTSQNPVSIDQNTNKVKDIPFTELDLATSNESKEKPKFDLPKSKSDPCINKSSIMQHVDKYLGLGSPKPNLKTTGTENSNSNLSTNLIKDGIKNGLLSYENALNKDDASGSLKLTKEGYKLYTQVNPQENVTNPVSNLALNEKFEVGLLSIHSDTLITLPIQEHLVVVHDYSKDTVKVIGMLTSNHKDTTLLSKDQPISGNSDKAQYLQFYNVPYEVTANAFYKHTKGTTYIQKSEIQEKLENLLKTNIMIKPVPYETLGVTHTDIKRMLDLQEQLKKHIKPLQNTTPTNFLSEDKEKKTLLKKQKAELNVQKQKAKTEKNQKTKQEEHLTPTKYIDEETK